jgi:hypothetical protein
MKGIRSRWVLSLLLVDVVVAFSLQKSVPPRRHRLLYLTQAAGFRHASLPLSEKIVRQLGETSGAFDTTIANDCSVLTAENLKDYDAVFFFTSGDLPLSDRQKTVLLDFVRSGKGFIGVHSATDTLSRWPEYGEMLGGSFDGHPWRQEVVVRVEDRTHPATAHLPESFRITDEIYQFKNWSRDKVRVLLSLDVSSVDLTRPGVKRTDKDFALAWCRTYGKGRVFYTAFGDDPAVWQDERFQKLLLGGIRWAIGELPDTVK